MTNVHTTALHLAHQVSADTPVLWTRSHFAFLTLGSHIAEKSDAESAPTRSWTWIIYT